MARATAWALAALLALAPAAVASGFDVIADCNANNGLSGDYSAAQLQEALNSMPADVDEYSDCRAIISAALNKAAQKNVPKPAILNNKKASKVQLAKIKRQIEREARKRKAGNNTNTAGGAVVPGAGKTLQSASEPGMPGTIAFAIGGIALIGIAEFAGRTRRRLINRDSGDGISG